jgi:lipoate-protein ligase B
VSRWTWLGRIPFDRAAALQEDLRAAILAGAAADTLLLCEHDPVVTLGKRARPEHLLLPAEQLARLGVTVHAASRGGEATYHGPGQLVAYPVIRLRRGVRAHVEAMAQAVIELLTDFGVVGSWNVAEPGVWVEGAKICAFGVHVRHGVAVHGLALNLQLPPERFGIIVPCGKPDGLVTSLHRHASDVPDCATAAPTLASALGRAFGLEFRHVPPESLK